MKHKIITLTITLALIIGIMTIPAQAADPIERTYTLDADFDEGILNGVEHDTVHDQLQLGQEPFVLPFIWVPNSNEGTISKYDTVTGKELGRYRTGPTATGNPSRTTVDLNGDVWFGNRGTGTVVKIGLSEFGHYDDRNSNGTMETSTDLNDDGVIDSTEILPWWEDECVLFEVLCGDSGSGPRGIAIDANNDLWAGTYTLVGGNKFFHIDGDTGLIIAADTINLFGPGYSYISYGAVVDGNGYLWSSGLGPYVLKIDPTTKALTYVPLSITSYGLGIDSSHLFVAGWGDTADDYMAKINLNTNSVTYGWQGAPNSRGVAVTGDGDVWVVNSYATQVTRLDNNLTYKATIDIGSDGFSTGVAVDADGKVWACNFTDGYLHRIDPNTNAIDLSVQTPGISGSGVGQHYSYSDMTGIVSANVTTKIGTWTVDFDSGVVGAIWGNVSWNDSIPTGTSVTVRARSSTDGSSWSAWEDTTNGGGLSSTPDGQYLRVETTLKITSGEISPILYDLTIQGTSPNEPPDVSEAYANPSCLWPPNHKFVDINILGITDPDGDPITITITSITSDEPTATDEGSGGAKNAPDAIGVGTDTASVRAERSGDGDGRVYVINFEADDGQGGLTVGSVSVGVPHDQSDEDCSAVDSGQIYDATVVN